MLLGNYSVTAANPGRCITHAIPNPYKWRTSGNIYSFYTGDATVSGETDKSSFPNGYIPPYTWCLAPKAGGLASINLIEGTGDFSITSLSLGKALEANLDGSSTVSAASLSLVTSMAATIAASGTLSAGMVGIVNMACSLAGTGQIDAAMGALAWCVATLEGNGALAAELRGELWMSANIYVNQSEATVQQIVDGVWEALTSDHNNVGTMGKALSDAGGAGNPWSSLLSTNADPGTFGEQVGKKLLKKTDFIALK